MPEYNLHVLCPTCGGFHDAHVRIALQDVFDVRRVSDVYKEATPREFYQTIAQIHCDTTNKKIKQEKPDSMVLVAVDFLPSVQS